MFESQHRASPDDARPSISVNHSNGIMSNGVAYMVGNGISISALRQADISQFESSVFDA